MANWFKKAMSAMLHWSGSAPFVLGHLSRTRFNYAREVGDSLDASVVMSPIQWVQRAVPEARFRVMAVAGNGSEEEVANHELVNLIQSPTPYFGDVHLWAATVLSYLIDGNAYWIKVRNNVGKPVELWWVPHWSMQPKWPDDGSAFISHYVYSPGGNVPPQTLAYEDVVHFRHGVNPNNPRKGLSPLHAVLREIFTDLEASNFTAALLKNSGVPGVVISPEGGASPTSDDLASVKAWFSQNFGGDNRGQPLVMGGATKVSQYGFSPSQMDMSAVRDVAEERVCSALGIPPAVVGFGAGLQTAKVGATMTEFRKLAWTGGVLPVLRVFADEINRSLLPDFRKGTGKFKSDFDVSEVQALQDDLEKLFTRWNTAVQGGWAQVADARDAAGLDVDDSHRVYLRAFSTVEVPAGQMVRPEPEPQPAKSGSKARRRPSQNQRRYVEALQRAEGKHGAVMQRHLKTLFKDLGKRARDAARDLIDDAKAASGQKSDDLLVYRILDAIDPAARQAAMRQVYEAHFVDVATEVAKAGRLLGITTDLPDAVGRIVAANGGRRAGLVDLESQSRKALFSALAEGRAEGEGVQQLAARIAEHVEAGPWASVESRALTIARTETKFAQNVSSIEIARASGTDQLTVFDGRLGPDRSDPDHIARDGIIVTADEAAAMAAEEHPNGTLSFAPYFDLQEDDQ